MTGESQKFIARNRAPRVQIEYDVELYGSEKKVQLPFVMGVLSDLSGKSHVAQPAIDDRRFLDIDVDSFDDRMKAMQPRVAFSVPNTLTGEGNLNVDLTFEKMDDFSPGAIAAKIEPLRALLEARSQLSDLMAYMDGKAGAEALIEKILADPSLLGAISVMQTEKRDADAALETLRALAVDESAPPDSTGDVLAALKSTAPEATVTADTTAADVLASLSKGATPDPEPEDQTADILNQMRSSDAPAAPQADQSSEVLDGLRSAAPSDYDVPDMHVADTLARLAASETDQPETDDSTSILSTLAGAELPETPEESPDSVLAGLAASGAEDAPETPDAVASVLDTLADSAPDPEPESEESAETVLTELAATPIEDVEATDSSADILAGLADLDAEDAGTDTDPADAILSDLTDAPQEVPSADLVSADDLNAEAADPLSDDDFDLDDLLSEPDATEPEPAPEALAGPASDDYDLDDLLGEPDTPEPEAVPTAEPAPEITADEFDLDDLLGEPDAPDLASESAAVSPSDDFDLDDLLGEPDRPESEPALVAEPAAEDQTGDMDLDDLLSEPVAPEPARSPEDAAEPASDDFDLDDLLGEPDAPEQDPALTAAPAPDVATEDFDLDDLLSEPEQNAPASSGDLDNLLGDLGAQEPQEAAGEGAAHLSGEAGFAFGTLSAERPGREALKRKRFRLAILGDFSGRAARGVLETGDALANRRAILLDPDTVEDVIEGFATGLVLPIGRDGAGVEIALNGLDDLHPDELYDSVEIFAELSGLRARLGSGATAENAMRDLRSWGEAHGTPVSSPRRTSSGNAVPAGLKLTDFQKLIGDTTAKLTQASPLDDMLARIVGPHVRAVPDADAVAMQSAVDDALSSAMRMILHHPEFQSIEAQWRSIDLIARSIETDDTLEVMLYDVSAEEIAADLASAPDLGQSGLARMLTGAPLDEETGRGGYSALIGLYTFEETPPHAEILGRIARVAAHVDAPFVSGLSPTFLDTAKADRHPLVAASWDGLRALPEAGYLGLVTPRFLLRRPYGAKSEPIYAFKFEEFTMAEGLGGMLWANPCVLVAILLARSFRKNGASMGLGSVMSLGGMPYHFVTDRHGDQVALPCTERNLTLEKVEKVMTRGVMPVVSIKGRDEIRLASFQSLAGGDILGPWSGVEPPPPSAPKPQPAAAPDDDLGLDDLLAGFDDANTSGATPAGAGDIDADLAALLEDL